MAYDFPPDLLQLKRKWMAAEARWRDAAQRGDQEAVDEAYKATQALTMELHRHPWMHEQGNGHHLRMALREAAAAGQPSAPIDD